MSDLIKKIKIKKQDGTFTDYIPIGAEAENVNVDGESVEIKLNKTPYYYNSIVDMKADEKLKVGDMAITLGYYEANDGGNGEYKIVSGNYIDDGGSYHELGNGLFAELILGDQINVKQFGCYGDNIHDDTANIQKALDFASTTIGTIFFNNGLYLISDRLEIKTTINIIGEYEAGIMQGSIVRGAQIKQTGINKSIFWFTTINYSTTIKNIRFSGQGNNQTCIAIDSDSLISEFVFENIHFAQSLMTGIRFKRGSIGFVHNCDFSNCNIGIDAIQCTSVNIMNNNFWNNDIDIKVGQFTGCSIEDNWFESTHEDSIGLLLQAPSIILWSSFFENEFQKVKTCVKFDGITNINEVMTFRNVVFANNRFSGSNPWIIDMKNDFGTVNINGRFDILIKECVFNNATSGTAIEIDYDALGSTGFRVINSKTWTDWSGGSANVFTPGQSNTAIVSNDSSGYSTNGIIQLQPLVHHTMKKNNSIFLDGQYNFIIKDNDGNENNIVVNKKGSTDNRPQTANVGDIYYDTTIHKPLWWSGVAWLDVNGQTV